MSSSTTSSEVLRYALPADLKDALRQAQQNWDGRESTARLWRRDASLWTDSDENEWLGWLDVIDLQLRDTSKFKALAAEVKEDGFTHVVALGAAAMDGVAEVFGQTFGTHNGCPELLALNTTDPLQVEELRSRTDPSRTLFCVSEDGALLRYFFSETERLVGDRAGHHFLAITESSSPLHDVAAQSAFRHVYPRETKVGERFAAFSDAGMLPHAAAGYDTEKLLRRARLMADACKSKHAAENPGVTLGLILGTAAARFKRDKVTLICSRSIHLGAWIQELLTATCGGLVSIVGEPLTGPDSYGEDRVFACIKYAHDSDEALKEQLSSLEHAGHPVLRIALEDSNDIAQTIFQWQIAVAVAATLMRLNPFSQPDVKISEPPSEEAAPILAKDGIALFADEDNAAAILRKGESVGGVIRHHLDRLNTGDYFSLLAYVPKVAEHEEALRQIRRQIVKSKQVATALEFSPRSIAWTSAGVFLQITCDDVVDISVPGLGGTFGMLKAAEARAGFELLNRQKRRALRVHLGSDVSKGLCQLRDLICAAVEH